MKTLLLAFALTFCPMVYGQALPDAPSQTTCVNKGKPCPEIVHKLIGQYPPKPEVYTSVRTGPPAKFFTFRGSWEDPPLRTNKEMFKSKTFVLSQLGAVTAMIVACRNPRSHEEWHSEVPAVIFMSGFSYLGGRFFTQSFAVAPGVYGIIHYSIAAAK